jgi:hypothetical protein
MDLRHAGHHVTLLDEVEGKQVALGTDVLAFDNAMARILNVPDSRPDTFAAIVFPPVTDATGA